MTSKHNNNKSAIVMVYRYFRSLFAVIGVALVIYHLCFEITVIHSNSMAPTLIGEDSSVQDHVLTEKVSYLFRKPRRWEIVRYFTKDELETDVMKRVVGLEGENISIKDRWVQIDGKPIERPQELEFLRYLGVGDLYMGEEVKCDSGYFLLGDDSRDSYDSRFSGLLNPDDIESRAWMIIWPPSRIRLLTP